MQFSKQPECKRTFTQPYNILVAFKSDSSSDELDYEYQRFHEVMNEQNCPLLSGMVSALCVVDKGFWWLKDFEGTKRSWCRLVDDCENDRLVRLVGNASNTAYRAHAERQGRDPSQGLEAGIGSFIPPAEFMFVDVL